jgi:hypothetical protein
MSVRVGQLWHYPVKSMQGEPTDEVMLGPGGVVGDRAYGSSTSVRVGDSIAVEPSTVTGGPLANVMEAMALALQSQARG